MLLSMKKIPEELLGLQTFLLPENYLQWQERWELANPQGFRVIYVDVESFEEVLRFLGDEFRSTITQILQQFSQRLAQKRVAELASKTEFPESYSEYGQALREILENVRSSKITSKYAEFLHKAFTDTATKLQEKLDIDVAYSNGAVVSGLLDKTSVSPESNPVSTPTSSAPSSKRTRGKGKIPSGGYKSIHPNPEEAVRQQFKFLDQRICRVSTLSEDEFEQFVLVTTSMIGQNTTIASIGQFAKAVNSEITYSVLTHACSDLKKTVFDKKRPDFYVISMANLFGFDPERFYKDFSEGVLKDWWEKTFPKYEIAK